MNNLRKHAIQEFRAAGWLNEHGIYCDEMQEAICKHVLRLLDVFADEGHSGSSAPYAINVFRKLAAFEPIIPLTGEEWEWSEALDTQGTRQNNRCSRVFRRKDGTAYDIDGRVFREPDGCCFTSRDSFVDVTFPYVPHTEYVDVPKSTESERHEN